MYKQQRLTLIIGLAITIGLFFSVIKVNNVFAWHENLAINDSQTTELYNTHQNDPLIKEWQDNIMEKIASYSGSCFNEGSLGPPTSQDMVNFCMPIINDIFENCNSHPNSLLVCLDPRYEKYVKQKGIGEEFPKIE